MLRRQNQRGLSLIELIVAFTILLILTTMAVPLARSKVRSEKEHELRRALIEMRNAIDKYKDYADQGLLGPQKVGAEGYPESLDVLVDGVKLAGQSLYSSLCRGKSGLRRAGCRLTAGRREATESGTESTPPMAEQFARLRQG